VDAKIFALAAGERSDRGEFHNLNIQDYAQTEYPGYFNIKNNKVLPKMTKTGTQNSLF
jgi:hypothetical protein